MRSFGVDVHQSSVLIPLLLIAMLGSLFTEFRTDCPKLLLYKDDLVIKAEYMEELLVKLDGEESTCEHIIWSQVKWSLEFKCTKCMWHKLLNDGRWIRQHWIKI